VSEEDGVQELIALLKEDGQWAHFDETATAEAPKTCGSVILKMTRSQIIGATAGAASFG